MLEDIFVAVCSGAEVGRGSGMKEDWCCVVAMIGIMDFGGCFVAVCSGAEVGKGDGVKGDCCFVVALNGGGEVRLFVGDM